MSQLSGSTRCLPRPFSRSSATGCARAGRRSSSPTTRPPDPPPPIVQAVEAVERPGALGMRTWRIHARKGPAALPAVLAWVSQSTGRVVYLAETAPTLHDVLAQPALVAATSTPAPREVL